VHLSTATEVLKTKNTASFTYKNNVHVRYIQDKPTLDEIKQDYATAKKLVRKLQIIQV
jgi:hypothetical protein